MSSILRVAAKSTKEKIPGTKSVAERLVQAEDRFLEALMNLGKISRTDAEKVMDVYWKHKAIKRNGPDNIKVVHGGFLDKEVIRRALDEANGKK